MNLLRPKQVAELLSCSLSNVYALLESGRLPSVSVGAGGAGLRVMPEDVKAFIDSGRHGRRPKEWPEKARPVKLKHLR